MGLEKGSQWMLLESHCDFAKICTDLGKSLSLPGSQLPHQRNEGLSQIDLGMPRPRAAPTAASAPGLSSGQGPPEDKEAHQGGSLEAVRLNSRENVLQQDGAERGGRTPLRTTDHWRH